MDMDRSYDLSRFTAAHERDFALALGEIRSGLKQSHWIWYIFPVIRGFRNSSNHRFYAIGDLEEARLFMRDPYLGGNLLSICQALLDLPTDDAGAVFGRVDDVKLQASMTLFAVADGDHGVFRRVLDKFFCGQPEPKTLELLGIPVNEF